ncbi:uncharacterized protein C2845_PM11G00830 [Panicum miliaceum]|uniref:BZIP domain-containing protein n=1 Tax=Panicum miliaceum TaxID=4540 RepID=A0A3L6RRH0_PANMI|nr:uncharacterized protein C2845_PM11G00830 [Panicum miliaceum]
MAAAADADADALAADIICSLRGADLAGWTPPWCKPAPREGELIWPPVSRGKRSRRRSPSAPPPRGGEGEVGSIGRPQLTFPTPPARATGQRQRKKLRLPEVQQLVRSLTVENDSLREEMRALQRACKALSKENDKLEIRLGQSDSPNEITSKDQKGKEQIDEQVTQLTQDSFVIPDLNLPPQDTADVSQLH